MRPELAESLSFLIAMFSSQGEYKHFEIANRRKFLPPRFSCHGQTGIEDEFDLLGHVGVMGKEHLLGPSLIAVLCTCMGSSCSALAPTTRHWGRSSKALAKSRAV